MSQVRQLVFAAALCVVAIAAYTAFHGSPGARAESPPQSNLPKYLRFNGTGTVSVTPDQATIHFSTTGRAGTLSEATNEASSGMDRVLVAMREMGVKKHDTQTDGVSGYKDLRDTLTAVGHKIPGYKLAKKPGPGVAMRSKLAIDMFCYDVARYIAQFAGVMGGADAVLFTAGVGERSAVIRDKVMDMVALHRELTGRLQKRGILLPEQKFMRFPALDGALAGPSPISDVADNIDEMARRLPD